MNFVSGETIVDISKKYVEVCYNKLGDDEKSMIDMYANSQMNAENPDFCDFFFADGLHPNAKGHEYYGRFITKWFNVNYISF